jgi:hypothetical protein
MNAHERAFRRLQRLEGEWRGGSPGGKEIRLTYRVASNNSIVIESYRHRYDGRDMDDEMVTVYHLDDGELVLTHYCTLGNQPRMKADLDDAPDVLRFGYVGATNLSHPDCLRMSGVTFEFESEDRFTQTWYWCGAKAYIEPEHRSDDFDELPPDGPGEDTFTFMRVGDPDAIGLAGAH